MELLFLVQMINSEEMASMQGPVKKNSTCCKLMARDENNRIQNADHLKLQMKETIYDNSLVDF